MSFRTKLTVWNTMVLLVVLVSFGITATILTERAVMQGVDRDIQQFLQRGRGPGGPPEGGGRGGPMAGPQPRFANDINGPRTIAPDGKIIGPQGQTVLSEDGFLAAKSDDFDLRTETIDGRKVRVGSAKRSLPDGGWQVVQVARDLTDAETAITQQRAILLFMLPIAVVVAALGGAFLVRRALKPVEDVTEAAKKIQAEDLSLRLEVHGNDEMAELARTFNGMVERLETSFTTLEESYERQKRFVGDASHELRTPLSRIKLLTSSSLTQQTSDAEKSAALKTIDLTADEMTRLVESLLQLARADAGAIGLEDRPFDVCDVVVQAAEQFTDPRVRIEIENGVLALGDPDAVRRIVVNLLTNALRHSPDSSIVTVSATKTSGSVSISVKDQGEGIASEDLTRVKDRFFRVDSSRNKISGGTGLGLSICDSLARAMGGSIEIESASGTGTTATIVLRA